MRQSFAERNGLVAESCPEILNTMSKRLRLAIWDKIWIISSQLLGHNANFQARCYFHSVLLNYFEYTSDHASQAQPIINATIREKYFSADPIAIYNLLDELIKPQFPSYFLILPSNRHQDLAIHIMGIMDKILEEYRAPCRFVSGTLTPITSEVEISSIMNAMNTKYEASSKSIVQASKHLMKGNYKDCIAQATSALESLLKDFMIKENKEYDNDTLGKLIKSYFNFPSNKVLDENFREALQQLWKFASNNARHGKASPDDQIILKKELTEHDSRFYLITCSSIINFIISHENEKQKAVESALS